MSRSQWIRIAAFFIAGMALVLVLESDFQSLSQLADMFAIDYVFLAIWGSVCGALLWAAFRLVGVIGRGIVRALR